MIFVKRPSFRRRSKRPGHTANEINMTPLIDVLLVLIIIFMVTSPMLQVGVPVDLPQGHGSAEQKPSMDTSLVLSLSASDGLHVGQEKVERQNLIAHLEAKGAQSKSLILKADRSLPYEKIIELMSFLASYGYGKLMLLCESAG